MNELVQMVWQKQQLKSKDLLFCFVFPVHFYV